MLTLALLAVLEAPAISAQPAEVDVIAVAQQVAKLEGVSKQLCLNRWQTISDWSSHQLSWKPMPSPSASDMQAALTMLAGRAGTTFEKRRLRKETLARAAASGFRPFTLWDHKRDSKCALAIEIGLAAYWSDYAMLQVTTKHRGIYGPGYSLLLLRRQNGGDWLVVGRTSEYVVVI